MDFFEHQAAARRKTGLLGVLFGLAVLGIVFGVYAAVRLVMRFGLSHSEELSGALPPDASFWDPQVFLPVAILVTLFITIASAAKTASLSGGGGAVARMLGGRAVARDTTDAAERRLLNVVDEMAIASGVPVPEVYVLEREEGINAFAAGHSPRDAAVAVTDGTLRLLNRDELQGVVAHEFSHILNGDMRLNVRLIGVVFGILALGIFGRILLQGGGRGRRGGGAIAIGGLMLMLIGYIGTFIGRLIQSAVSRQREYLADSAAVQFTRNPRGLAGALKKIGGHAYGSRIETPKADQARHLFFSPGRPFGLLEGLMQTHPPLIARIKRIDPSFDGNFPVIASDAGLAEDARDRAGAAGFGGTAMVAASGLANESAATIDPRDVVGQVGSPDGAHLVFSAALLESISADVREAVRVPHRAALAMLALLLDPDPANRERQQHALQPITPAAFLAELDEMRALLEGLPAQARLPLADLALPALKRLSPQETDRLIARARLLVMADQRVTLFEFCLQWLLAFRLVHTRRRPRVIAFSQPGAVRNEILALLAALAYAESAGAAENASALASESAGAQATIAAAWRAGLARWPEMARSMPALPSAAPSFDEVGQALHRLALASPEVKRLVIDACAHAALQDRSVTLGELELLRVISISLDCPLPPFLPEEPGPVAAASEAEANRG
ncbi:MAG: M48 family metallopeptidase [Candidatus Eisenbacteria bacterium]|nr:M48 family metallopeptidase [Candidatus Eisenbacteria bacterium]